MFYSFSAQQCYKLELKVLVIKNNLCKKESHYMAKEFSLRIIFQNNLISVSDVMIRIVISYMHVYFDQRRIKHVYYRIFGFISECD